MTETRTLKLSDGKNIDVSFHGEEQYSRIKDRVYIAPVFGFEALDHFIDQIEQYRQHQFDSVILITGEERSGKSTLAFHIATRLGLLDVKFISFSAFQLLDVMKWAPPQSTIWEDEAGAGLYADEWWGLYQRQVSKGFQIIGVKGHVFILVLPHRSLLLKKIRNLRIRFWLHCYTKNRFTRGFARIRKARRSEWNIEPFWEPVYTLKFPKVTQANDNWELWIAYLASKDQNIASMLEIRDSKFEEKHRVADLRFIWYLTQKGVFGKPLTHRQVSEMRGCSREYITQIVNKIKQNPELLKLVGVADDSANRLTNR